MTKREKIAEIVEQCRIAAGLTDLIEYEADVIRALTDAADLLESLALDVGEPVAWDVMRHGEWLYTIRRWSVDWENQLKNSAGYRVVPLYTHREADDDEA